MEPGKPYANNMQLTFKPAQILAPTLGLSSPLGDCPAHFFIPVTPAFFKWVPQALGLSREGDLEFGSGSWAGRGCPMGSSQWAKLTARQRLSGKGHMDRAQTLHQHGAWGVRAPRTPAAFHLKSLLHLELLPP